MNLFLPSIQFRWYLQRLAMSLAVLLPLVTNGCMTYRVNNLRDTPDTIPGDRKCERAVSTGSEAGAPDGLRTLRAAVMEPNASVWKDTVEDPSGLYQLTLPLNMGGGGLYVANGAL